MPAEVIYHPPPLVNCGRDSMGSKEGDSRGRLALPTRLGGSTALGPSASPCPWSEGWKGIEAGLGVYRSRPQAQGSARGLQRVLDLPTRVVHEAHIEEQHAGALGSE